MNTQYKSLPTFEPRVLQGFELELVSGAAVTNGNYSTANTSSCCHADGTDDNDSPYRQPL